MKKKKHYDGDVPTVDDFSDAEVVEILECLCGGVYWWIDYSIFHIFQFKVKNIIMILSNRFSHVKILIIQHNIAYWNVLIY